MPGAFILAAVFFGLVSIAPAEDNRGQGTNTVCFSWQSVPGYIVGLGKHIVNRGKRALEPEPSYQYREPTSRQDGQQNLRNDSMEVAIQQALARNGYYSGPIDGNIGPISRRAIANYQADRGMRITGYPNDSLLASLGLQ